MSSSLQSLRSRRDQLQKTLQAMDNRYMADEVFDHERFRDDYDDVMNDLYEIKVEIERYSIWNRIVYQFQHLPQMSEAYLWAYVRISGGPMTVEEYDSFQKITHSSDKEMERHMRLRARTQTGWFLSECWKWLFGFFPSGVHDS